MGKYRVCVYAICKNESQFAARWMESMAEADGIYVLDTGSTDGTPGLLRGLGAIVEEAAITPWRFDAARNRSLELVPSEADICVCTDLDEVFTPGWRAALEAAWGKGVSRLRYKYVWSFTPEGKEDVVFYGDKIHARQGYAWVHPVHEVLRPEGHEISALAEGVQLNHHPDPAKSRAQYLPLLELAVAEDPEDDRNMHYLGREYLFRGRWEDCIRTLRRHLALPRATWRDERCASWRYMARAYAALGREDDRESCLLRAAAEAPWLREPWLDCARRAYEKKDWAGVLYFCRRALAIASQPQTYIAEAACYGALPHDLLSVACWHLGLRQEALSAARRALALAPGDRRIRGNVAWMEGEKARTSPAIHPHTYN